MKIQYAITAAFIISCITAQASARDYIPAAPKEAAGGSVKEKSDERIRSADKLNSINNKINLYQGGHNPGDEIKSRQYIMEKNKETFKRK